MQTREDQETSSNAVTRDSGILMQCNDWQQEATRYQVTNLNFEETQLKQQPMGASDTGDWHLVQKEILNHLPQGSTIPNFGSYP